MLLSPLSRGRQYAAIAYEKLDIERGYSGALTLEASAVDADGRLDAGRLERMAGVAKQLGS